MANNAQEEFLLTQAAEALFRFGRLFSRIGIPNTVGSAPRPVEFSRILAVQAVEAVQGNGEQEVTVGAIAQQLAIEASTASRLVADTIKDGYLVRRTSPVDNRRVQLELTDMGRTLAQDVRAYQLNVFRQVTSNWTEAERQEFARLFVLFTEAVAESLQTPPTDQK